jgi:hypothetical protein
MRRGADQPLRKEGMMEQGGITGLALVTAASVLACCAADSSLLEQLTVVPGYYDTLDCPELVGKLHASTERVRELILLMERSGEDSAGALINAVAYNTEYAKARSIQKNAEEAAVRKRCDLTPNPGKPATSPDKSKPLR